MGLKGLFYRYLKENGIPEIRVGIASTGDGGYEIGCANVKYIPNDEALANARLLAAAPELLTLTQEYRSLLICFLDGKEGSGNHDSLMKAVNRIDTLFAKIKSEST